MRNYPNCHFCQNPLFLRSGSTTGDCLKCVQNYDLYKCVCNIYSYQIQFKIIKDQIYSINAALLSNETTIFKGTHSLGYDVLGDAIYNFSNGFVLKIMGFPFTPENCKNKLKTYVLFS